MDHYDAVIVGAGSAGCVLANRLSERTGCRVLAPYVGAVVEPSHPAETHEARARFVRRAGRDHRPPRGHLPHG